MKTWDQICQKIIAVVDTGYDLMLEYDSLKHRYGDKIMYQAEIKVIQGIGQHSGVTITELSEQSGKSSSAYSQIVHRLMKKGLVRQTLNGRERILFLTDDGWKLFQDHKTFEEMCYSRTFEKLKAFSQQELETFCRVQECLNAAFKMDVEDSYEIE